MVIYRNIFFNEASFLIGNGDEEVYYTGKLYEHAISNSDFFKIYDKDKDLVISCNACAKKNIKFIKKSPIAKEIIKEDTISTSARQRVPKTGSKVTTKTIGKKQEPIIPTKRCKHCNK